MKINHHVVRVRPDRLDVSLPEIHVGLYCSAFVKVLCIPDDVTSPEIVITTPSGASFRVNVGADGSAYIEPGMLDKSGEGSYHIWAVDSHANQTPLGYGTISIASYPDGARSSGASPSVVPVSAVLDANGVARQLIAVQDETGTWTLTVGSVVNNASIVDPSMLPEDATESDSMAALKAKVNAIKAALKVSVIAFALAMHAVCGAATLNEMSGTNEVYTASETDAAISNTITSTVDRAYVEGLGITGGSGGTDGQAVTNIVNGITGDVLRTSDVSEFTAFGTLPPGRVAEAESTFRAINAAKNRAETDPTVPSWAKAENPPVGMTSNAAVLTNGTLKTKSGTAITAAHVGAGSATDTQTALSYASGVYNYMNANTNAWFSGTNYVIGAAASTRHKFAFEDGMDLTSVPCSMSLFENRDGTKQCVWDQRDWTAWYWSFKASQMKSEIAATNAAIYTAISGRSPAAWATRTAATGLVNPDASTTWVDTDKVTLAPGMAWETVATVSGCAYWTIVGRNVQLGGGGTNSVFQIKDFEGNSVMKITKTASYLTYLEAGSDIYTSGRDADGRVTFTMRTNIKPTAEFSTVLSEDTFIAEGEDGCPANYEWEQVADGYCCHFILKPGIVSNACFARFKVEVQGSTTVEYEDGITIKGGLIYNDVKIVPVIPANAANGTTITWKVVK